MARPRMTHAFPCARSVNNGTSLFRWGIFGILVCGFLGFIAMQVWHVVSPPDLALAAPLDGVVATNPEITVAGVTDPEAMVEINGQQVFSRPDGTFAQPVELQNGANRIFVRATKKHGLFTTVSRTIMLQAPVMETSPVSLSPEGTSAAGTLN